MEDQVKKLTPNTLLMVIAIGIWVIVLQNTGIIPTAQRVKVENEVDVNITGKVKADVSGSVDIGNTVDMNIKAINGQTDAFYDHGYDGVHNRIPVYTGR